MIDYTLLSEIYNRDGIYALQLEVGDICHQDCIYCYMNALPEIKNMISNKQIKSILGDAAKLDIAAIEWLGGEPLLRDNIFDFMAYARDMGFRNNIWTGGLPLYNRAIAKQSAKYSRHGLIAFHLSTIDENLYQTLHPSRPVGDLYKIIKGVEMLLELGYPASQLLNSVTFTGLQPAEDMIATMDYFEENYGIKTSLNVYHTYLRPGIKAEIEKNYNYKTGFYNA